MPRLNMKGPYPLTVEDIDRQIPKNRIGNYAYGYINKEKVFVVTYVGRSDSDLNTRIKHGIMENIFNPHLRYEYFKFSYASSVKEAYEKECQNYHDFGGEIGYLANEIHPAKPEGTSYCCPVCNE